MRDRRWIVPASMALVAAHLPLSQALAQSAPLTLRAAPTLLERTASIFQILTGVATVGILYLSVRASWRLKMADVLLDDHRRFDQLMDLKDRINSAVPPASEGQVKHYFERFWTLQLNEFDNWRDGLISDEMFRSWLVARLREHHSPEVVGNSASGGLTYSGGWKKVETNFDHRNDFRPFINEVLDDAIGLDKAMRKFAPKLTVRLARWLLL